MSCPYRAETVRRRKPYSKPYSGAKTRRKFSA